MKTITNHAWLLVLVGITSTWAADSFPSNLPESWAATDLGKVRRPGPEVAGYCGWFDFNNAINAMKRKDGEYILFAEDDGAQKVNIFRWVPAAGQRQ